MIDFFLQEKLFRQLVCQIFIFVSHEKQLEISFIVLHLLAVQVSSVAPWCYLK